MTKRLLAVILVVALMLSMVVFPVGAEQTKENVTAVTEQCPCGCGPISQADWKPYNLNDTGSSPMGHYYLAGDYAQKEQKTIISGSDMIIDLRGHTLTTSDYTRLFLVEGYLAVLDTVGGGRFQSKTSGGAFGGVIMVRENETKGSAFELYSGTLTVDPDNKSSLAGGLVYVSGDRSVFRMYGGVACGGTTAKSTNSYYGGAIAVATATAGVEILGGTIMDCSTASTGGAIHSYGVTRLENCRIINCSATSSGGAIYQSGGSLSLEGVQIMSCDSNGSGGAIYSTTATSLTDCSIWQCKAKANGGNIAQAGGSLTTENCDIAYGASFGDLGGGNIYTSGSFTDTGSTIRDGFATGGTGNGGGNIMLGAGTHTLTGTTVKGGVSQKYGANILSWSAGETRFIDCQIDGDVRWANNKLSLEGKTKIGLRGNGLNLVGSNAGSVISASKLTEGAEIFVSAHYGVFTNDEANLDYFKPALRTVLSKESDGTLSGEVAASGAEGGYCPHCYDPANPKKVIWQAYTSSVDANISQSGHYYLSKACTARFNIMADADVVIDLNGLNITSGHRCFVLKKGATLSVLDFNGAGKVTGKGGKDWSGGVIFGEGACTVNIYGGTYTYTSIADSHVAAGGVIYAVAGSKVNIHGGSFDGSSYNKEGTGNVGAVVNMANGASEFNMTAGRVFGGHAYRAGTMSFGTGNTVKISGGVLEGGSSVSGSGSLRMTGSTSSFGNAELSNCAIADGSAAAGGGGNLSAQYYNLQAENCYLFGGSAEYGGNYMQSSDLRGSFEDVVLACGSASRGGNMYAAAIAANLTYTDCKLLGGKGVAMENVTSSVNGSGGNLYMNNGTATFVGGEIAMGTAQLHGGNIYTYTGTNATGYGLGDKLVLKADASIPAPVVSDGYAAGRGGNIYTIGVTHITDARIGGGRAKVAGQDLLLDTGAHTELTIGAGVTGNIRMVATSSLLGKPVYGNPISGTAAQTLNANIVLEDKDLPVFAHNGSLFAGGATVVDEAGKESWYIDNAAAVAACGENAYVKLYTGNDLVLTGDLTVDLNGQTVAVSGNGKLFGMDNSGDAYALPKGKTTGTADIADITNAPNGNIYLAVKDGDAVSYHRLGMAITEVALRIEGVGLYYKAAWSGDSVVNGMIAEYGIATSLEDMPTADFKNDPNGDSLWVGFTDAITNGTKQCGVLVKNILKQSNTAANNDENGKMSVFATAYVTLTDGTTYVSGQNISYSLYDFMEQLDDLIQNDPTFFRRYEKRTKEFYAAWEDKGMADWKFDRLKVPQNPNDDNEYNIIMIGSSFCYYYVEELYELLTEAGYENVRVCNVYYSGCPLSSHYKWWVGNQSNYQFYEVDSTGRHTVSNKASLEYCLARHNWDVISIQGNANARTLGAEKNFQDQMLYHSTLLPYLKSEFPNAKHAWHQTWTNQIGYDRNGYKVTSAEQQHNDMLNTREYAIMLCEEYDYLRINSSEAWQVVREKYGYDTLCNRLGKGTNHEGDYYHEGDIGGGQLLNACVWFEILTGLDCTKMEYVPVYKYNGKVVENLFDADMIKAAAHEAVQAMNNGGCAISLDRMPLPE